MTATTTRPRYLSDAAQWVRDTALKSEHRKANALIEDYCRNASAEDSQALRDAVKQQRGW